jgi:hypothetical protein
VSHPLRRHSRPTSSNRHVPSADLSAASIRAGISSWFIHGPSDVTKTLAGSAP